MSKRSVGDYGMRTGLLSTFGVKEKTKFVEMLIIGAREHFELAEKFAIVLMGEVFAPIFLLFFHVI